MEEVKSGRQIFNEKPIVLLSEQFSNLQWFANQCENQQLSIRGKFILPDIVAEQWTGEIFLDNYSISIHQHSDDYS